MVQCRNCGTNGEFNYLCHKCRKENLDNEIMSIMAYVNPLSLEDQEIHSRSLTNLLGIDYSSYGISNSVEDPNDYENILNTSERPDDIREGENIKDRWMVEEEDIDTYEENENLYDDSDDFTESISDSTDEDENIVEEYEDDSEESVKKFNDPVILNEEKIKALEEIFNSRNTVVRTRAGSGKSTLLLSLVNRLINEHDIEKDNILLLSFNKAVREKNAKTLREKWGVHDFYGVQTFHSLALQIVRPDRANIIEDQHNDYRLVELVGNLIRKEANMWFKLRYWRYLRELDKEMEEDDSLLTLLGEYVKSYGEKEIANYLFEYGIKYKYEPSFDWDGKQYRPDFMIEDGEHSAIIEYWGRNDDRYKEQMVSKRQYWRRKDKTLIEMYPDDFKGQGQKNITNFKNVLRDKLLMFGFSPHLLTEEERAEGVFRERFMSITKALLGFIQYARMQLKSPDEIDKDIEEKRESTGGKSIFFTEMANFTYRKYIEHIVKNDLYDFCRMLEDAAKIIDSTSGECTVCLCTEKNLQVKIKDVEWILADEFQDCSPALNALLQAIQNVNERARFVCVGDDWQAINGFSGSDTKYINNFSSYFQGASESTLLTNLRSPQNIVDCSNNLMRGHGMPARSETQGGDVRVVTLNSITGSDRYELIPEMYITAIRQIIDRYPSGTEFAVLTRANKFFSLFQEEFARKIRKGFVGKKIDVSTVHKYKGREVDVVIIANVTEKNFPLLHPDRYRHEILGVTDEKILLEERRLFYVALTRAVKAVYLITEENRESPFIADLRYSEVNPEDGIIEEIPF